MYWLPGSLGKWPTISWILIFNVRLDEGEKTISSKDRNISKNLVKFADSLPFSYSNAPQKQVCFDENKSNQQLNENI